MLIKTENQLVLFDFRVRKRMTVSIDLRTILLENEQKIFFQVIVGNVVGHDAVIQRRPTVDTEDQRSEVYIKINLSLF